MSPADGLGAAANLVTVLGVAYGVWRYYWTRRARDVEEVVQLAAALRELAAGGPKVALRRQVVVAETASELEKDVVDGRLRTLVSAAAQLGRESEALWDGRTQQTAKDLADQLISRARHIRRRA